MKLQIIKKATPDSESSVNKGCGRCITTIWKPVVTENMVFPHEVGLVFDADESSVAGYFQTMTPADFNEWGEMDEDPLSIKRDRSIKGPIKFTLALN